ncbi:LysR family transcriptional regulator [Streptacidiphilus fuscans]|uniref:LysR family transcriptional regulator n=1 Tax=Streptacidiphilus fuscans TaxID=2789292 RepID=A0A931AY78_9ACTN|nr:LysR family transcriptional regulator [Streptacidiphilus fuscans]MBF9066911.1 LysR family transcriptional regulator [Streptacidiphilus fuscans]
MLNTHRLHVLAEIDRSGSIAGAARRLRLSPSAVSHQLAQLEKEVGVSLVERGAQSLRLTSAGRRLSLRGQEVLALLDAAEKDLLSQARADSGHLRIGFFASAGYRLLPQALSRFSGRYPAVELELVEGEPDDLADSVQQGAIDALIAFEYPFGPWAVPDGVQVRELLREPLHLVVPTGHPAGRRAQVRLQELAGEQWMCGTGSPMSLLERICALEGFVPNIRCRSDHYEVMLGLVRAGMGIALVPSLGINDTPGVQTTRVSGPRLYRRVMVASRPGNPNPLLNTFLAYLGSVASNLLTVMNRQRSGDGRS